ncbi:DHH family phosphoesterase, partial [Cetobacterium sp.]|uniref:DHH family phosphoesterase n=1 Tax=Cetobacterium sp. TaxID=2071632 RepID=UPI003EE518CE
MKYILKGIKGNDVIGTVMENRGIGDLNLLLNPNSDNDTDPNKFINIDLGVKLIEENLFGEILILVDSDVDGNTSAAIMYKFLKNINPTANISYYIHSKKKHGLTEEFMEYLGGESVDLIIVPDAGSNDVENIEKIETIYGAKVLVIDHHEVSVSSKHGVIINNQTSDGVNKNLTGAGMTYLFCKKLNEKYDCTIMSELSNLAMLGQIGDGSNLIENEVRNMCMKSMRFILNRFMQTIYTTMGKDLNELTVKDFSFTGIIPLINSVARVGTLEEKTLVFEALADINIGNKTWRVERRKLNKEIRKYEMIEYEYDLYQYAHYICEQCVTRQRKAVDKVVKKFIGEFDENMEV